MPRNPPASNSTDKAAVGLIGLGTMGGAMAANLARNGYKVVGYDTVPARRAALKKAGGQPLASIAAVAKAAPFLITSLPSEGAVAAVMQELAASAARGRIVAEMSTMTLAVKESARATLAKAGLILLDCPVSGTGRQAAAQDLVVLASGPARAVKDFEAVFPGMSRSHYNVGPFGNGSKMKFVANLLVAIHNVSAAEAFVLGRKAGLDPEMIYKVIGDGAGSSRIFQVRGPMMVKGDYHVNPSVTNHIQQKDMRIITDFARDLDCPTPMFNTSTPFYAAAIAMGHGDHDTASVCAVLEEWAGIGKKTKAAKGAASKPAAKQSATRQSTAKRPVPKAATK
jgi:3-hydroxyisobutyrate dehydrogenase-like beta-hydroxyacid dehydrogenase